MKKAFIHVGAPKAGSTAIQIFCRDKAEDLAQAGFHYPVRGRNRQGAHHKIVNALRQKNYEHRDRIIRSFNKELKKLGDETLVISTEVIFNILGNRTKPIAEKLRAVNAFMDLIVDYGYQPILIFVLRDAPAAINSGYSQAVKSFFYNRSIDDWVDERVDLYVPTLKLWTEYAQDRGFEMRAIPFNSALRKEGVIPSFLDAIGFEGEIAQDVRANVGTSPATVFAALTLMDQIGMTPDEKLPPTTKHAMRRRLLAAAEEVGSVNESFWGLRPDQVNRIARTFRPDQEVFAKANWDQDWDSIFNENHKKRAPTQTVDDLDERQREEHDRIVALCVDDLRALLAEAKKAA